MKLVIKGYGDKKHGYGEDGRLLMTLRKKRLQPGEWEVSDGEEWPLYNLKVCHEKEVWENLHCELTRLSDGQCLKVVDAVLFPEADPKKLCKYSPAFAGIGGLRLTLTQDTEHKGAQWKLQYQKNDCFDLKNSEEQKIGQAVIKSGRWECELQESEDPFLLCGLLLLADYVKRADSVDIV